jgi:hypothetical protein
MKKNFLPFVLVITIFVTFSGCERLDVVANYAVKSFSELSSTVPGGVVKENAGHTIYSPDRTESFIYGDNILLSFDLVPFINAGLNSNSLNGYIFIIEKRLIIRANISGSDSISAITAFEETLRKNRKNLSYHMDHDVFEFELGSGNSFRWAKDLRSNIRDMVFVLNPASLVPMGIDTEKLAGWRLTDVPVRDSNGKMTTAQRLLKFFNIK